MSSEHDLIRRAQAGETEAFCLLAQMYGRRIYSLAFHYCRDRQDAEDLSQDVWLNVYGALSSFRHESTFYTWLRKITINCFLNHRRRHSKQSAWRERFTEVEGSQENDVNFDTDSPADSFEVTLQNQLIVEQVMRELSNVTPHQRLIFLLKHQEGMTYEEISKALGCSTGAVKKSVARTITKLRNTLGANDQSENYISCTATGMLN